MAGKYDRVVRSLSQLASEESGYQEKVDETKKAIRAHENFKPHASHLASLYVDAREQKAALEEEMYQVNLLLTALEQMTVEQYEVEGTNSIRLDSGASVSVQMEPYAQVQDREVFRQWCVAQGLENLMSIPWQTTNSLTKERLLNGEPEPPGVKAFAKAKIVLRNK